MPHIAIREATAEDCHSVIECIHALAAYEKLAQEVSVDQDTLRRNLFGPNPNAFVLLAEVDGSLAGFCVYFYNFSTFLGKAGIYIEDIFVKPDYRGYGIGKRFMVRVCEIAAREGCGRVEWAVLDWNKDAVDFYEKLGASAMDEWTVYRLTHDRFTAIAKRA